MSLNKPLQEEVLVAAAGEGGEFTPQQKTKRSQWLFWLKQATVNTRAGSILPLPCRTLPFQRQPLNFKHLFPVARQHECQRGATVTQISSAVAWRHMARTSAGAKWEHLRRDLTVTDGEHGAIRIPAKTFQPTSRRKTSIQVFEAF